MKILGIETSCDETAVAIIEAVGTEQKPSFDVLDSVVFSQTDIHAVYGGVFPQLAKREHARRIIPMIADVVRKHIVYEDITAHPDTAIKKLLEEKEPDVYADIVSHTLAGWNVDIDAIAVTQGPGLEPALWVGINTACALALLWNKPLILTNHMEGHIISPLLHSQQDPVFPALAVLISGGHTELVTTTAFGSYSIIGKTRDDAVGEAFDKVARLLGLSYPGGPEISKLAAQAREEHINPANLNINLPRPMIHSKDLDFSFSGIKTAVLYLLRDLQTKAPITDIQKKAIACEFEDAITEVLVTKVNKAIMSTQAQSLLVGGGVIANTHIRNAMQQCASDARIPILLPTNNLSTDNATMIAMAAYINHLKHKEIAASNILSTDIRANGNLTY